MGKNVCTHLRLYFLLLSTVYMQVCVCEGVCGGAGVGRGRTEGGRVKLGNRGGSGSRYYRRCPNGRRITETQDRSNDLLQHSPA